jgi:hypothetical protein
MVMRVIKALYLTVFMLISLSFVAPMQTVTAQAGTKCDLPNSMFFGFPTWYKYLEGEQDAFGKCTPKVTEAKGLLPIGLAILDMLLRLAGLVAVIFLIYAGFQYITSQGEPDKTTQAKDGIINALVGLGIAMVATALVAFIASRLTS